MKNNNPVIRAIYLYIFTLLGLVLIIIGSVKLIDIALKTFIFKQADEEQRISYIIPPVTIGSDIERKIEDNSEEVVLTEEEINQINQYIAYYNEWKEKRDSIDPVTTERQRDISNSLAMMLIGLPLYLYHWGLIKKEKSQN